ncbi:DUF1048 domain-containing protein [Listeria aquatica]|uniref:DUF1048 domain-containing protein n=1 Tax=Listeria aquatica TaxID=1494960 RepID=UPI003F722223
MWNLLKKMVGDKKEYREMMARVKELPEDYQFVYDKIQHYMWNFAKGSGYDMLKVQYDLIDLFEAGSAEGKAVLEITGTNVAAFCDDLLANCRTYTDELRKTLNESIMKKLGGK